MTTERAVLVRLSVSRAERQQLLRDIRAASARVEAASVGERTDVVRYEALVSQLELLARQRLQDASTRRVAIEVAAHPRHSFFDDSNRHELPSTAAVAERWIEAGDIAVELRLPFTRGSTDHLEPVMTPPPPAAVWKARDVDGNELVGSAAAAKRFREQLRAVVSGAADVAIEPSGVANRVLTDGLWNFVGTTRNPAQRVDAPVRYRDGSSGPNFPLRFIRFSRPVPPDWRELKFAMLSIRHTEMDALVDGAWLRNVDISQDRPHGDVDRIAFEQSIAQLEALTEGAPVAIHIFQTGLQPAVMGVYRAVAQHLFHRPGSLAVIPRYFRRQPVDGPARYVADYRQQGTYARGKAWVS